MIIVQSNSGLAILLADIMNGLLWGTILYYFFHHFLQPSPRKEKIMYIVFFILFALIALINTYLFTYPFWFGVLMLVVAFFGVAIYLRYLMMYKHLSQQGLHDHIMEDLFEEVKESDSDNDKTDNAEEAE